jgi:SAM-dependent methyltransferase
MNFWRRGKLRLARALRLDVTHPQAHYARFLKDHIQGVSSWLDIGCGRQIVPPDKMPESEQKLYFGSVPLLVGVDVDEAILQHPVIHVRVIALCPPLPFRSASFDLVTANMVIEHVRDPAIFLREVHRVLRPDGTFIFHTPNSRFYLTVIARFTPDWLKHKIVWYLEGRREADIFETFYNLNRPEDITRFADASGFEVVDLLVKGGDGAFGPLGPIGWLECFVLKLLATVRQGRYNSNLIVRLRKRAGSDSRSAAPEA